MIPVQLTFQGLYSYAKSTTIDFEPLVSARLFGIFGPVGSGKSAILEAIMFVLFDRTTRLNKAGDDRYYNMMNLQSNRMSIDFIFKGGRNNQTKYRFYFMAHRSTKDFNRVEVKDRSYYQWDKNDWKPLKSPEVLGMTYENFMQTVIIPQGKFRQFIDQKATARTEMMNELFHLNRFDIAPKAFRLLSQVKEEYHFLQGTLSQYEEINSTLIKQLNREIEQLNLRLTKNSQTREKLEKENQRLLLLKHTHQELEQVMESMQVVENETDFYQQKQLQLNRYLRVKEQFQEKVSRQQEWLEKARQKQHELEWTLEQIALLETKTSQYLKEWKEAQRAYSQKDHMQSQLKDLTSLVELREAEEKLKRGTSKLQQLTTDIQQLDEKLVHLEQQIEQAREAKNQKYALQTRLQELLSLTNTMAQYQSVQNRNTALKKESQTLEKEIEALGKNYESLKSQQTDPQKILADIHTAREHVQALLVEDQWRKHTGELEDGKPCPLCGSTSHPHPRIHENLQQTIDRDQRRIKKLEISHERQMEIARQLELTEVKKSEKELQQQKNQRSLAETEKELVRLSDIMPEGQTETSLKRETDQLRKKIASTEKQAATLEKHQKDRGQLQTQQHDAQKSKEAVTAGIEQLQGTIGQISRSIQVLDIKGFSAKDSGQLKQLEQQLTQKLERVEQNFQQCYEQLQSGEQQLNQKKGILESLEEQVAEIRSGSEQLEVELQKLCKKEGFKGLSQVSDILKLDLKPDQERQEIEKHQRELHSLRNQKQTLAKKMGKHRYHEVKHNELTDELDQVKSTGEQIQHQLSSKTVTLEQYQFQLKKKQGLEKELETLTVRKNNVQDICNLLRGNGFMNFISSVYLQNLVEAANLRFRKLTGNRLSLELSDQNEFMVRDHLNEGRLRLLKTLSGGQIFQASLSLALGLAENVKKLNQAEQSFFFLDEGFGSLDQASLQLVFETLKSLQKENRVVGIISHVEELQSEIDTFLRVEQDPEQGSKIHFSWAPD